MPLKLCNTENMRKFVEALRSGDYVQGQNSLEYTDISDKVTNCCLGVACRVAIKDGLALQVNSSGAVSGATYFADETAFLPHAVQDWLGIATGNPVLKAIDPMALDRLSEELLTATYLNDSGLCTFSQIADAFERTYLID